MSRSRVLICFLLVAINTTIWGQERGSIDDLDQWKYCVSGMRANRGRLRTGRVLMLGEHTLPSNRVEGLQVPFRYEIIFDHNAASYRYSQRDYRIRGVSEYSEKQKEELFSNSSVLHGRTADGIEWVTEEVGGTIVHTTDYDLYQDIHNKHIDKMSPGLAVNRGFIEWDLRCMGLLDMPAIHRKHTYESVLDGIYEGPRIISMNTDSSRITRVVIGREELEWELWIDEKSGMSPIRMIHRDGTMTEKTGCHVGWKEINEVWVPVSVSIWGKTSRGTREAFDLTMDWSNVNAPVDSKMFTTSGVSSHDSALIVDMRLGPTVVERVNILPLRVATPKAVRPKPPSWLGWIVLGHLIAGGVFAWWYYRRKSRRQSR